MCFVAAFAPRFSEVGTDGSRRTANLIYQGIALLRGKSLRQLKNPHRSIECHAVNPQVLIGLDMFWRASSFSGDLHPVPPSPRPPVRISRSAKATNRRTISFLHRNGKSVLSIGFAGPDAASAASAMVLSSK